MTGVTASQIMCLAPRPRPARTGFSSTTNPARRSLCVKPRSGPCDQTASTPPGFNAARAVASPASP